MLNTGVRKFLDDIVRWAHSQDGISCVILIGSYARGTACTDSDVDIVLICADPHRLIDDDSWVGEFGITIRKVHEDWGKVQSIRVFYADGLEVEFGITDADWLSLPLDSGTRQVLQDGYQVLLDSVSLFKHDLLDENESIQE